MFSDFLMKPVAHIRTAFPEKFGIPRQSGYVPELKGQVIFEPEYRNPDALRGLEEYSHIWLVWIFSQSIREEWSPTVRPPRLGGNQRKGVFATRSPFRPNPIGLSSVRLESVEWDGPEGPVIHVSGVDLMDGTPILDIKPYVVFSDSHPDASGSFAQAALGHRLKVIIPDHLLDKIPAEYQKAVQEVLALDPRPAYQNDPERIYGFSFAGMEIRFRVQEDVLNVEAICSMSSGAVAKSKADG